MRGNLILGISLVLALGISGCSAFQSGDCCDQKTDPNAGQNPVGTDLEVCWNNPPDTTKYIRVQSKAGGISGNCSDNVGDDHLDIYVWHDYKSDRVADELIVCADQALPSGWVDVLGAFNDPTGCDAAAHPPGYANVRKYRRVS